MFLETIAFRGRREYSLRNAPMLRIETEVLARLAQANEPRTARGDFETQLQRMAS